MLDILLFIFAMTIIECGAILLTTWLWRMSNKTHSENIEDLCLVGFLLAVILACLLGLMLASSAVLGTIQLFKMYA